jgi:integrase
VWLFPSRTNTLLDHNHVAKRFKRALKDAKLPGFCVYDLRHTFASQLLALGAPISYVAEQLGHARPTTTLARYARWIPKERKSFAALLDAKTAASGPSPNGIHNTATSVPVSWLPG